MKYKVQEHESNSKEFIVYMVASNGEVCKQIAVCKDEKDANLITQLLEQEYLRHASGH